MLQVDTAIRSAANAATFGGADRFAAAADALFAPGGLDGLEQRFDDNLQREQARDLYDSSHRQLAQSIGSVGGDILGLLAFGPGGTAAASRLAGAAKLTAREAGNLLGLGGLTGLGSQVASDVVTGHRSSMGDTAAAFAGGVAGTAAWPLGPIRAGAIDGAVTSLGQDLFNGRRISIPDLTQSAYGAGFLGGHLGAAGRKITDGLSMGGKGKLGGVLGDARERLNGGKRMRPNKRAPVTEGQEKTNKKRSYWYPDATDGPIPDDWTEPMPKMFEDKFGYDASTSPNQKLAQANFGEKFQLNHFTPDDVAMMAGLPVAGFGPQAVNQTRRRD
ncbi:MAG: hypothetical protein ACXWKY_18995 [Caulobacteraceae bacterium]